MSVQVGRSEILGQLLAAHMALQLLPDAQRAAGFAAHALRMVPGVQASAAILDGRRAVEGSWDDLALRPGREEAPAVTHRWTSLDDGRQLLDLTVRTLRHHYGSLFVLTHDRDEVEPYVPFLGNFAAAVALALDDRRHREELERANRLLDTSQEEYRQLFDTMTSAFALHEIITDAEGRPVDYRFLAVNDAFEQLIGLERAKVVGRTVLEVIPNVEPFWIELYGQVALEGRQVQLERYSAALDRHLAVIAYRPSPGRFAAVINDVSERTLAELERQRLIEQLQRVATTLQENLIHPLPVVSRLEVGRVTSAAYAPDLVGGDFSHVFVLDDQHVGVLIGDVAGKGIKAAGLTETVRTAVSSFALMDHSPGFILRKTNDLLLQMLGAEDQFVTAFLLILDVKTGEASYASAGHPPPVHVTSTSCRLFDVDWGLPLGTFREHYLVRHVELTPGDCLVFYTDGVTEARRGGELFGERRLLEALQGIAPLAPQEVAERLREATVEFASELKDDLQILALRLEAP